ncbi:cell division control protein 10 [[Candida] anglica]|uniref:Cell division control protein 10 n=1 Tax=[Candida] anglica TaxID=148631 RepID=A0ABP0E7G9_9ASCO
MIDPRIVQRAPRKGNHLTLLLCGEPGTGKHTFLNTLAHASAISNVDGSSTGGAAEDGSDCLGGHFQDICVRDPNFPPVSINAIVCTVGQEIDNTGVAEKIVKYLENQFSKILEEEIRIKRNPKYVDTRVHVALYFIRATGKGLNELDIKCMQKIGTRCNLIPIISKADTLTRDELIENKNLIQRDLERANVRVFSFTSADEDEDEEDEQGQFLQGMIPFAVMTSEETKVGKNSDEILHYREFPWGEIIIEEVETNEFNVLKAVLLSTYVEELRDRTNHDIYEQYRTEKLQSKAVN